MLYLLHGESDSSYDIQLGCCMLKWNFLKWTAATLQQIFNHTKNGDSLNRCSHDHKKSQDKWLINDMITITSLYLCCVVIRLLLAHLDTVHPSNAVLVVLWLDILQTLLVFFRCASTMSTAWVHAYYNQLVWVGCLVKSSLCLMHSCWELVTPPGDCFSTNLH